MGTIQTALAAVSAVHTDGAALLNPTYGAGVKARLKGAERFVLSSKKGEKLAMSLELFLMLLRLTYVGTPSSETLGGILIRGSGIWIRYPPGLGIRD